MGASKPDAVVIGAGLGGLLSAAYLARAGHTVQVYEKLLFFGGKFTSFDRDGFCVPTGALHALPGGTHGPIARACHELGVPLQLHVAKPGLWVRVGDERRAFTRSVRRPDSLLRDLSPAGQARLALATVGLALTPLLPDCTLAQWLRLWGVDPEVRTMCDRLSCFSFGVPLDETSARDLGFSLWAQRWHTEGVVRGGVGAISDGLVEVIRRHGGRLHKGRPASRVMVAGGRAVGVAMADGEMVEAGAVISCVGAAGSAQLLGDHCPSRLRAVVADARPAWGVAWSIRSQTALVPHAGIEVPLDARLIAGYVQVSAAAPELAPEGWHYVLAYQVLAPDQPHEPQMAAGRAELSRLFHGLRDEQVFNVSVYRGSWPAARLGQSIRQVGSQRCPTALPELPGFWMVSHDAPGHGIAAEVIPGAARRLPALLHHDGLRNGAR